jgi:hypothetical protein
MTEVVLKRVGHGADGRGEICVWEPPREGAEYIIGADVAQGATFGTAKRDADKSTICVLRRDGMLVHQVVEAVYQVETFAFGQIIAALGRWYNNAWVNVERNMAHGPVAGLRAAGYPLERWYIPPIQASTQEAQAGNYFFHKNVATQKILLDTMLAYMDPQAPRLNMRSRPLLAELMSLQIDANGRVDTNGKDLTIALAMAIIVDATTEVDLDGTVAEPKKLKAPWGVDPEMWNEKHGIKKHKPQEHDEAPEWESAYMDAPDWEVLDS